MMWIFISPVSNCYTTNPTPPLDWDQLKLSVQESIFWWFWRIFSHSELQDLWGVEFHLEMTLSFILGLISVPIFTHEALDCVKFFWWFSSLSIVVCMWFSLLDDMPPLTKLLQPASQQALLLNHKQDDLLNLQNPYKPTSRIAILCRMPIEKLKGLCFWRRSKQLPHDQFIF